METKVLIAGGTGNIGRRLTQDMIQRGWMVSVLTRSNASVSSMQPESLEYIKYGNLDDIRELDISEYTYIVNLAGATIANKWTESYKKEILDSRIGITSALAYAIISSPGKPSAFFSASASGYYGDTGEEEANESNPPGKGFLAEVCRKWEESARAAEQNTRLILGRIGVVLDRDSGMIAKLLPQFRAFAGGTPGSGHQWLSWIHIADLSQMIIWALENDKINGAINLCSPYPMRMKEFTALFGHLLGRPAFLKAPAFVLKLMLGESSEMVLSGQKLKPAQALQFGFEYQYPDLKSALGSFFSTPR